MAIIPVLKNDATATRRYAYFDLRDATDGITPELSEAGGQPQISLNGAAWTNTGIGVLQAIGNGRYYAELTQAVINESGGDRILTRFKSANTAETPGDEFFLFNGKPYDIGDACWTKPSVFNEGTPLTALQAVINHAAAAHHTNVWYVNKSGNDGNGGQSWENAFLTIGAAVSAASAGDTILIGPGTFSEQTALGKTLTIIGAGAGITNITDGTGTTLTGYDNSIIRHLTTTSTKVSGGVGLDLASTTECVVADCTIVGTYDGLLMSSAIRPRLRRCLIDGTFDGVNASNTVDGDIDQCVIKTDATYTGSNTYRAVTTGSARRLTIRNSHLIANRNDVSSDDTVGIDSGQCVLINTIIEATQDGAATGDVAGVRADLGGAVPDAFYLIGCKIITSNAGSGNVYDLEQSAGTLSVSGTDYDTSKVSGTITDVTGAILIDTGTTLPASIAAVPTSTEIWQLASIIDGKTPQEALQIIAAVAAGEISGAGTATEVFLGLDGLTTRVTVSPDSSGNRTTVVYG